LAKKRGSFVIIVISRTVIRHKNERHHALLKRPVRKLALHDRNLTRQMLKSMQPRPENNVNTRK